MVVGCGQAWNIDVDRHRENAHSLWQDFGKKKNKDKKKEEDVRRNGVRVKGHPQALAGAVEN